jgi:hypothetical protein
MQGVTKSGKFLSCLLVVVSLLVGACLNPIDFNPDMIPTIPVKVSGEIEIIDSAVLWIVNRTKDIEIVGLTIERDQIAGETDRDYAYPKTYDKSIKPGGSFASYHTPSDLVYTVNVAYKDGNGKVGTFSFGIQFPRPVNYMYYLYWDKNENLQLVDETKLESLPPDPDRNYDPNPVEDTYTMLVLNVTQDQDIDQVMFEKTSFVYAIANEPGAGDQQMLKMQAGSYTTTVSYTKGGSHYSISPKNTVVTSELSSMASKTNFLYFYKTNAGSYDISSTWPPIPDNASSDNSPEAALVDDRHGILEIINKAMDSSDGGAKHLFISKVLINGTEYPDSDPSYDKYLGPGEPAKRYVLDVGPVNVQFMPAGESYYGQNTRTDIKAGRVTTVVYTNSLGNPWGFPPNTGNGSGLIRVRNNSTAVVIGVNVYDSGKVTDTSSYLALDYGKFNPAIPINYGKLGLVPVTGTDEVRVTNNPQLIQVMLQTVGDDELVVFEHLASIDGQVVEIVIDNNALGIGGSNQNGRYGSLVTVANATETPTTIMAMYVYNKARPSEMMLYPVDISSPSPASQDVYVLNSTLLPIVDKNAEYAVKLTVSGNGKIATVSKDFDPNSLLYSKTPDDNHRSITLTQADLDAFPELIETFIPVTYIGLNPIPYTVTAYTRSNPDGTNKTLVTGYGSFSFHTPGLVVVGPIDATKKTPVKWEVVEGGAYVAIDSTGLFTVKNFPLDGATQTIKLKATIEKAAGTVTNKVDFVGDVYLTLKYENLLNSLPVTSLTLADNRSFTISENAYLDLRELATFDPDTGININGTPITKDDIEWYIDNVLQASDEPYIYTPVTPGIGTVTVRAVLPANKNGGTLLEDTTTLKLEKEILVTLPY